MTVEFQNILNLILSLGCVVSGWFARELWTAVKELKADLAKLREELPQNYVPKVDFKDAVHEIKALLITISSKLDAKVDK